VKIIGVDVGLRNTGYAALEDGTLLGYGVIRTTNDVSLPKRLKKLHHSLKSVIEEELPQVVVYETLFYKHNAKTLCALAQARGVLLLAAEEVGIEIQELTPAEIKQAISGSGRASKYQVHGMVERLLNVKLPPSSDIADAIACALSYSMRNGK
jgi:crossover junction endodeoxyribonuclease RuvC